MTSKPFAYLGIDPGMKGSIVCLYEEGQHRTLMFDSKTLANATPIAMWEFLDSWSLWDAYAVIEQQTPRPTRWFDKKFKRWQSSVLASTVVLYGSYMQMCGMLTASRIPHEVCPPQRWQKELDIAKSRKSFSSDADWKRFLKTIAQRQYPLFSEDITLATADALLLAHYAREKRLIHSLDHKKQWRYHEEQE